MDHQPSTLTASAGAHPWNQLLRILEKQESIQAALGEEMRFCMNTAGKLLNVSQAREKGVYPIADSGLWSYWDGEQWSHVFDNEELAIWVKENPRLQVMPSQLALAQAPVYEQINTNSVENGETFIAQMRAISANDAEVIYADPNLRLQPEKEPFASKIKDSAVISGFFALLIFACVIAFVLTEGLPSPIWEVFSGATGIFILLGVLCATPTLLAFTKYSKGPSPPLLVDELSNLKDGKTYRINGIIQSEHGSRSFGRDGCVFLAFTSQHRDKFGNTDSTSWSDQKPFFLCGQQEKILIDPQFLDFVNLGDSQIVHPQAQTWAAFVGDKISIIGKLTTLPDGQRAITEEVADLDFFDDRHLKADSDPNNPVTAPSIFEQAPSGPAAVVLRDKRRKQIMVSEIDATSNND